MDGDSGCSKREDVAASGRTAFDAVEWFAVEESDVTDTIQPMAHLRCDFFSETLALSTSMTVILPQATSTQIGMTGRAGTEPPPVLYLLHGLSDDHTIWLRRTSIERYVAPLGLAVGEEVAGSEHDLFALLDR